MNAQSPTAPTQNPQPSLPRVNEPDAEQRRRAVRAIASAARDAEDCALLLDALGLDAEEGRTSLPTQREQ
ncbi:hypothetical protein GCM10009676_43460 [Prauserella halophila]|uniref:Uncharacterized protein n=1 Tax=Prauserella halophila TaxID=185641 RepID=A0ABP4H6D3_9PSEU|nr:hypothetical protein [Prauserella halophila]MCP2237784.1 hypothetical protein [Prauserella halophila]